MEKLDFQVILKKYLRGEASPEEIKMIDSWYEAMGKAETPLKDSLTESELEKRYWATISDHLKSKDSGAKVKSLRGIGKIPNKGTRILSWYSVAAAAVLLLAVYAFIYLVNRDGTVTDRVAVKEGKESHQWEQFGNTDDVALRFTLPDGSSVTLEPKSRIKFSPDFNQLTSREVFLEGEGLFEVVHNPQRPFLVHANEITTKVLGTSFVVRAFQQDKDITVSVKTGKVSVYANLNEKANPDQKASSEIILTPNQEIVFDKNENRISRKIAELPQPVLPAEEIKRMRFEEAPVKEIFIAIEKIYGVEIEFDEALYSSCTLTTSVSDGGLYNRLDIITSAIGARYEMKENRIVIIGTGCN